MLREAVVRAADRADVREAVLRIYAALQEEIDFRKPRCSASGRCCRFDEYGHRLYVTTAELAVFVHRLELDRKGPAESRQPMTGSNPGGGCTYQRDGLCSVHAIRPFGCRVFFCDETSDHWQQEQYERFHAELKRIHERFEIPYLYVEWRDALRSLQLPLVAWPLATATIGKNRRLSLPQLPF